MVTFPLSSTVDMTMFLQLLYSIACTKKETLFISSQLQRKQYLSAHSYRESTICQLTVTEKALFVSSLLQRKHYFSAHCYRESTICQLTVTEKALFVSSLLQRKHSSYMFVYSRITHLTVFMKLHQPTYSQTSYIVLHTHKPSLFTFFPQALTNVFLNKCLLSCKAIYPLFQTHSNSKTPPPFYLRTAKHYVLLGLVWLLGEKLEL